MKDGRGPERTEVNVQEAEKRGDVEYLLEALADPSPEIRMMAAGALGEVGGERARVALASVARDRRGQRPDVRLAALQSLGHLYREESYASFLEEFITGDNRRVVTGSRRMLSEADPGGYPLRLLSRGCLDHRAIGVYGRDRLAEAAPLLGRFIEERAVEGDLLSTGCWGKVYVSVKALGNIGGEKAVETLQMLLDGLPDAGDYGGGALLLERTEKIRSAARAALAAAGKG